MSDYHPGLTNIRVPTMHRVRQQFPTLQVNDVAAAVRASMGTSAIRATLRPGMKVAVAVGSRGIAGLATLVKTVVDELCAFGCQVIIIPAMGSHGGATPDGQRQILHDYGITSANMNVSIISSMTTRIVGALNYDEVSQGYHSGPDGAIPVSLSQDAWDCDAVVPIVRIKPHTGFRGEYESGICKMLCIGLGKHAGCSRYHREGYSRFSSLMPAAAQVILATGKIAFALAVVENAAEQTAVVEAIPAAEIMEREPKLLLEAKRLMPRLLIPRVDVLVVERIGKNISGLGMDSYITGRGGNGPVLGVTGPPIKRIVVLGLTEETHGNASGIGLADLTTESVYRAINRQSTYINVLTSGTLDAGKIPIALPNEDTAIRVAMTCVPGTNPEDVTIVRIKDTLHLEDIQVSANVLPMIQHIPGLECLE
jgi:Lactate racemase N-terminal domain